MPPPWILPTWKEFGPHFAILRGQGGGAGQVGQVSQGRCVCRWTAERGPLFWVVFFLPRLGTWHWMKSHNWKSGVPRSQNIRRRPCKLTTYYLLLTTDTHAPTCTVCFWLCFTSKGGSYVFVHRSALLFLFRFLSCLWARGGAGGGLVVIFFPVWKDVSLCSFSKARKFDESDLDVCGTCAGLVAVWKETRSRT